MNVGEKCDEEARSIGTAMRRDESEAAGYCCKATGRCGSGWRIPLAKLSNFCAFVRRCSPEPGDPPANQGALDRLRFHGAINTASVMLRRPAESWARSGWQ